MKISNRNSRVDVFGRHNDRNFDLKLAPHINAELSDNNKYYTYDGNHETTFLDTELKFYKDNFEKRIKEQNKKNIQAGHKERNKTLNGYFQNVRTRPEDKILQIGNIDEHASGEELWKCTMEYIEQFDRLYGDHCKILDAALHMDEAVPHVHIRRVWIADDEKGDKYVSENEALRQMGYNKVNDERKENRKNNAKIAFTKVDSQLFEDICIQNGLTIEHGTEKNLQHLSVMEYKEKKLKETLPKMEERYKELESFLNTHTDYEETVKEVKTLLNEFVEFAKEDPFLYNRYAQELYEAEEEDLAKRAKAVLEIYKRELENLKAANYNFNLAEDKNIEDRELKKMTSYLKSRGLWEEYQSAEKAR